MRLLADRLPRRWNQPVVIENRPGGDGVVAISAFLNANDDHVLLGTPVSSLEASINAQRATVAAAAKSLGIKSLQ
jgi:tripartite-type tricarboxylate transporter receptor subunit TctC